MSLFTPKAEEKDKDYLKPDGTPKSGYVTPDLGPFRCSNCVHYHPLNPGPTNCDHPEVVDDRQVKGFVHPNGCCNYFRSRRHT